MDLMRRKKPACALCAERPARAVRNAKWCSRCAAKTAKVECETCGAASFRDVMFNGKRCRPCQSQAAHAKRVAETYGLAPGQYQELLSAQGGKCWICHRRPGAKRLAVDHDHATGEVRGLLCRGCNRDVLGHLRDSREALERALDYLSRPPASRVFRRVPKQPAPAGEGVS